MSSKERIEEIEEISRNIEQIQGNNEEQKIDQEINNEKQKIDQEINIKEIVI